MRSDFRQVKFESYAMKFTRYCTCLCLSNEGYSKYSTHACVLFSSNACGTYILKKQDLFTKSNSGPILHQSDIRLMSY